MSKRRVCRRQVFRVRDPRISDVHHVEKLESIALLHTLETSQRTYVGTMIGIKGPSVDHIDYSLLELTRSQWRDMAVAVITVNL